MTYRDTDDARVTTYQLENASDVKMSTYRPWGTGEAARLTLEFDTGSGNTIQIQMPIREFRVLAAVFREMVDL